MKLLKTGRLTACVVGLVLSAGCAHGSRTLNSTEVARLHVDAAAAAVADGDTVGAFQSLEKAEKADSSLPEIYHVRALAFYRKNDLKQALSHALKAVDHNPKFSEANNTVGKLLMDLGRSQEAAPYLKKAAQDPLYRDAFKPLTLLGIQSYREGDLNHAREFFDQAVLSDSTRACLANYYLGHISMKQNLLKDAIRSYDAATRKFCVSFGDAHLALGIAYERNRQYDQARQKFLDIKQRYPDTPVAEQAMTRLRRLP